MIFSFILWQNNFGSIFERIYFSTGIKWQNDYLIFFAVYLYMALQNEFLDTRTQKMLFDYYIFGVLYNKFHFLSYLCKEI